MLKIQIFVEHFTLLTRAEHHSGKVQTLLGDEEQFLISKNLKVVPLVSRVSQRGGSELAGKEQL